MNFSSQIIICASPSQGNFHLIEYDDHDDEDDDLDDDDEGRALLR